MLVEKASDNLHFPVKINFTFENVMITERVCREEKKDIHEFINFLIENYVGVN